ncbi:MAG: hypothetical protein R5N67_05145 [Cutibacterium granulosum]|nr:hypothetical protein [Cutibacterium granulosum]
MVEVIQGVEPSLWTWSRFLCLQTSLLLWIEPLEDDDWPHRELRLGPDASVMCLILPIAVGLRP